MEHQSPVLVMQVPEPFSRTNPTGGYDVMSGSVSVMGVPREMGGLRESLAAFRKHTDEVSDALLNISGIGLDHPVDKDEPRLPTPFQPWPKMVYHADGRFKVVQDAEELKAAQFNKFRIEPYPAVQIEVLDPKIEKKALVDERLQLQAQITKQADVIQKMQATLEALSNKAK